MFTWRGGDAIPHSHHSQDTHSPSNFVVVIKLRIGCHLPDLGSYVIYWFGVRPMEIWKVLNRAGSHTYYASHSTNRGRHKQK